MKTTRITFYLDCNLLYLSYFIYGFKELHDLGKIKFNISREPVPGLNKNAIQYPAILQYCGFFRVDMDKKIRFLSCIDTSDGNGLFDHHILDICEFYFKCNYNQESIKKIGNIEHQKRIFKGGAYHPLRLYNPTYSILAIPVAFYDILKLRYKKTDFVRRIKNHFLVCLERQNLSYFYKLRSVTEYKYDVFFNCGGYGEKAKMRDKVITLLKSNRRINFYGGFIKDPYLRNLYPENINKNFGYTEYLKNLASSKITIKTSGHLDCLAWKLSEQLALGKLIISEKLVNQLPVDLEDKKNIVFMKTDLSDLEDLVTYYLENEREKRKIEKNARIYFDEYMHPRKIVEHYLKVIQTYT